MGNNVSWPDCLLGVGCGSSMLFVALLVSGVLLPPPSDPSDERLDKLSADQLLTVENAIDVLYAPTTVPKVSPERHDAALKTYVRYAKETGINSIPNWLIKEKANQIRKDNFGPIIEKYAKEKGKLERVKRALTDYFSGVEGVLNEPENGKIIN